MKIIGLDVGTKRIGVAKADSSTRIAAPVGYVLADGSEWQEIAKIASLNNTNWFVLGMPRSNEGNETRQSLYVRQFAKKLSEKIPGAKIRFQDESLTSVEAEERLKARKKSYEKGEIDAEAAAIILQDFIENFNKNEIKNNENNDYFNKNDNIIKNNLENVKIITKKENDRVKMMAKKTKHKMKKWPIFVILGIILAAIGTGGAVWLVQREQAKKAYAEYVAWVESQTAEVFSFTIRPGETIFDIQKNLANLGYSETEITEAFNADYDFDFLKKRPAEASLEGYLYGETYEFYETASIKDILTKFLSGTEKIISENNLETRYESQGLSLFEGITLASIVQKESPAGEQARIAQIFLSRLKYGWRLGSDVTVSYALDVVDPDRTTYTDNSSALQVNSCYNTRLYTGLPCGPIASPNLAALLAVADPADTTEGEYLFFLTGDDGLMYYSSTESEHNQNIYLHCQILCNVSL